MRLSFNSSDDPGTFDLPTEQREFNRKLRIFDTLGPFGARGSGTRTIAKNRAVGGNLYSQHLLGLGQDYPEVTPENVAAFRAAARRAGLVAVDEVNRKLHPNARPHMHVQAFPAGTIPRQVYQQIGVQIREDP